VNRSAFGVGLVFGFIIAAARLSDYDVIHDMLLLREFDVFLLMGSAFATAAPLLYLLNRRGWKTPAGQQMVLRRSPVLKRNVLGAVVFGGGWAIAGTCPGPAIAMSTGGSVMGVVVMAGLVSGVFLCDRVMMLVAKGRSERAVPGASTAPSS
jgi:uncharacterized membrane protein YedE/YeeE